MDTSQEATQTSPKLPDNVYDYFKNRCKRIGISIHRMTDVAGVHRSSIDRWKTEEPKTFKLFRQMDEALRKLESGEESLKAE